MPKKDSKDIMLAVAKAAIALIPGAGSAVNELLNVIICPSLEKRRDEFLIDLNSRLEALENDGRLKIGDLENNEQFVDAVFTVSKATLATGQKKKKEFLMNALINVALSNQDVSMHAIFLYMIDKFTEQHMVALGGLNQLDNDPKRGEINIYTVKDSPFKTLKKELSCGDELIKFIFSDLRNSNLITKNNVLESPPTVGGSNYVSELGKQFIEFISEPDN